MTTKFTQLTGDAAAKPDMQELPADMGGSLPAHNSMPDIEWPQPDAMQQEESIADAFSVIRRYLRGRPGVLISSDTPVYYNDADGWTRYFRPDCYVAFGVNPMTIRGRNGYFIDEVGKPPDFVLEVGSKSTYRHDLGRKRDLYARLGIEEYWRFDKTGGDFYGEPLVGERLVNEEYQRFPIHQNETGEVWSHSPLLGLDLCWQSGLIRFYNPATGRYLHTPEESEDAREASEAARNAERAARQAAEARIRQLEEQLRRRQEG